MNLNNLIQFCDHFGLADPLSGISVPAPLDASLVRSAIVVRCGLLTPLYGEPDVFTSITEDWFQEKQWTFEHLVKIVKAEYSPIENYDRYENITQGGTDKHSGSDTRKFTADDKDTNSGTDTTENTISAENASTYQPDSKRTVTNGLTVDMDRDQTTTDSYGKTITRDETTESHLHGNIGVTQTSEMILNELGMLSRFDPYKWIAEQFEKDLMLMIY